MSIHKLGGRKLRSALGIAFLTLLASGPSPQITHTWQTFLDDKFDIDSDGMLEEISLTWKSGDFRGNDYRLLVRDFGYGGSPDCLLEFDLEGKPLGFEISDVDDDGQYVLFLEMQCGKMTDRYRFRGNVRDGFELPVLASTRYSR